MEEGVQLNNFLFKTLSNLMENNIDGTKDKIVKLLRKLIIRVLI
ncbi:MAG: hypothetical protein ACJATU_001119 [Rickettsiales bacterium]|jgi:hypothetical protein